MDNESYEGGNATRLSYLGATQAHPINCNHTPSTHDQSHFECEHGQLIAGNWYYLEYVTRLPDVDVE